jgi:hypothetical protein
MTPLYSEMRSDVLQCKDRTLWDRVSRMRVYVAEIPVYDQDLKL